MVLNTSKISKKKDAPWNSHMFSRGFRLAVPDFHQTNRGQIHKKLTTPKTEPDSPLSHHSWPPASLAGAKPSLIFTEFAGAAGGGEDAGAGASEPLNVGNAHEPFGWCRLSVVFCFSLMKNSFLECLLIIGFTDILNTSPIRSFSCKKNQQHLKI